MFHILALALAFFLISCGKKEAVTNDSEVKKEFAISAYESDEVKDFGKPGIYDYCYDGGGGLHHLIIKGDYKNLSLHVDTKEGDKTELIKDQNPIKFSIQGSGKVELGEKIVGTTSGKLIIKQADKIIFEKNFTSHGCQ